MRHLTPASPRSRQEGELSSVDWYIYRLFSISSKSVIQSRNFAHERQRFGLRWQLAEAKRSEDWSAAATPLSVRPVASKSGVAPALRDSRRNPKSVVAAQAALGLSVSIRG